MTPYTVEHGANTVLDAASDLQTFFFCTVLACLLTGDLIFVAKQTKPNQAMLQPTLKKKELTVWISKHVPLFYANFLDKYSKKISLEGIQNLVKSSH
jgi:hypothetical protein